MNISTQPALASLARQVEEREYAQPVTLVVEGGIVTGTLVPRGMYVEAVRELARATQRSPLLTHATAIQEDASELGSNVYLKDVEVLVGLGTLRLAVPPWGGGPDRPAALAIVRVADVSSWMHGHASIAAMSLTVDLPDVLPPKKTIMSIAPAEPGWRAVFDEFDGEIGTRPVVCWALVRELDDEDELGRGFCTYVSPVVPEVRAAFDHGTFVASFAQNFIGAAAPGQDPQDVVDRNARAEAIEAEEEETFRRRDRSRAGKLLYLIGSRSRPGQG